jgi:2-keto-3-deoxy-L-arabinonate dehydratase
MASRTEPRFRGVFPVVPTTFTDSGELDLDSQRRCVDFMIDAGSHGLCILANYSEQFALADDERELLAREILEHVAGRVPVIVTTSHWSPRVCAARSRRAQALGASMVMVMPPYHGATIRAPQAGVVAFFRVLSDAIDVPIMVQDAPVSGVPLTAEFLAQMAREIAQVAYFKIEVPGAAAKLRELIRLGGEAVEGPWDGEEGITLYADLEAGATGTMTSGAYPDGFRAIVDHWQAGRRDAAFAEYTRWLPLINHENRQCGLLATKALMREGGVIASDAARAPFPPLDPAARAQLLAIARRLDPLVLRWGS